MSIPDDNTPWQGEIARTATAVFAYIEQRNKVERAETKWRSAKRALFIVAIIAAVVSYAVTVHRLAVGEGFSAPSVDSVALIRIAGEIGPDKAASADNLVPLIEKACAAPKIKVVALGIDSPGGSPTEADRIVGAIKRCSPDGAPHKPVVAVIGSLGASAAYMIAMHTDRIMASRYALVGSIGAIIRYVDASEAASRLGLSEQVFRSGPLKGGPSAFTRTSPQDAALNTELVSQLGAVFLKDVIATRGKRLKVEAGQLQSGRIWTSDDALAMGLIDQQGSLEDLDETQSGKLPVKVYAPSPSVAKWLGADEIVRDIAADWLAPKVR